MKTRMIGGSFFRYILFQLGMVGMLSASLSFSAVANQICSPMALPSQNKEIILPGPTEAGTVKIYLFKNIASHSVWIDHPVEHASAGAGWSSYLRAGRASALVVNRKNFRINCSAIRPGKVDTLDCASVLTVCLPYRAMSKLKRKGTYWLVEDQTWDDLIKTLVQHQVLLK